MAKALSARDCSATSMPVDFGPAGVQLLLKGRLERRRPCSRAGPRKLPATAVIAPKLGQAIDAEVNRDGTLLIRAPREIEGAERHLVGADSRDLKVLISSTGMAAKTPLTIRHGEPSVRPQPGLSPCREREGYITLA